MKRSAMKLCVWVAGLVLCGALGGCAVLTVDVDVYKGALVNEEHVQLHQLVALTTAAQPMLVNLRDNLEWPESGGKPPEGATREGATRAGCLDGKSSWYKKGHVNEPEGWVPEAPKPWWKALGRAIREWSWEPSCQAHFTNPYARVVNNVLGLYDDLADFDFSPHGRKLREAVELLRRIKAGAEKDRDRYLELASGFKADSALSPELQNLKKGYGELLTSSSGSEPSRKVGKLMDALKELRKKQETIETYNELEADLLTKWDGTDAYKKQDDVYDRRLPFRAVWKLLGEGGTDTLLVQETRKLCEEGDRACETLLTRAKALADEYWTSRKAVRDIWQESLSLLIDIDRVSRNGSDRHGELKEKVIRLAVAATNVRHIASALDRLDREGRCAVLRNPLMHGSFCEPGSDGTWLWSERNVKDKMEYFEEALRRSLSTAPADMAYFLLNLDSLEKSAPQANGVANALVEAANKVNTQRVVRLGLHRSFIEDRQFEGAPEIFGFIDDVNRSLAQGFERGRLQDGLYTLTEAFLKSHNGKKDTGDSHEEQKLLEALVEFAQKLLVLANHEGLSSPPESSGLILGGAEKLNRGLFGDALTDAGLYKFFGSGLAERRKQQYVRVLQAVGNTILFSANELRERGRYRERGLEQVSSEVAAVNAVYTTEPQKVLNDLLEELRREQEIAQKQHDEAADRKKEIEEQLGSAAPPKTGLHLKEETARHDLANAERDLNAYRAAQDPPKAMHDVLTPQVIAQIKARWTAAGTGPATNAADFMTGSGGMDQQLTVVQQAQGGTLTPDERRMFGDAITYVKSPEARTMFDACCAINGHTALTRAELLDAFATHLHVLEAKRATGVAQFEQARGEKAQELLDIGSKMAQLKAELARLVDVIAAHPNTKARLATAATVIEGVKDEVLKAAPRDVPFLSSAAVYALLASEVKRKEDAEPDMSKKQPYQETLAVLSKRTPPLALPPLKDGDYSNPLEVMDQVIALLRHRQMEAVERFGKDSDEDKKATEALENAYQHRAGMIYIRPSSAYLRTSFPSTSLQDDPNLAWDNMLLKQGIRNLPFSSQLRDIVDPAGERDRVLTADLDKQFWQNINRVRVSGAGLTNQVLVKDDVGNWYVKQYFGDTEKIVKSAKHLALYSLGTKLPIDLSHELTKAALTKDDSKKSGAEKEAELPPLQQVFIKHKVAYQTHTVELSTRLAELHGKDGGKALYNQVLTHWEGDGELKKDADLMKALTAALGEEVNQWDKTHDPLKKASDEERGLGITKDLRALAKFEKALTARIQKLDKPEALRRTAKDEAMKIAGPILLGLLEDHKQALDRYEQAVLFIGDAANPKDPKQEQGK